MLKEIKTQDKSKSFGSRATPLMELLNKRFNSVPQVHEPVMTAQYKALCEHASEAYALFWKTDPFAYNRAMLWFRKGQENPLDVYKDFHNRNANRQASRLAPA